MQQIPLFKQSASFIIYSAFLTLFPYSKADFNMLQSHTVTLIVYAKHMLKYQDGRFSRHPLFHYYIFNWIIKEQAFNAIYFLYN